jgi:Tfp pilus assembly protein PilO
VDSEKRKRLLYIVAAVCIAAWVADTLVVTPLTDLWSARSARIQELRQDLVKGAGLLDREPALKAKWEAMKTSALPNRVSDAETAVLESVNRCTADSKLSVMSVKPRWNLAVKDFQTLEIQLEGVGGIDSVAKFLYDLEVDPLPLRVEDLEITAQDEKGARLNLTLRFTGLVVKEESSFIRETPPAPAKEASS